MVHKVVIIRARSQGNDVVTFLQLMITLHCLKDHNSGGWHSSTDSGLLYCAGAYPAMNGCFAIVHGCFHSDAVNALRTQQRQQLYMSTCNYMCLYMYMYSF